MGNTTLKASGRWGFNFRLQHDLDIALEACYRDYTSQLEETKYAKRTVMHIFLLSWMSRTFCCSMGLIEMLIIISMPCYKQSWCHRMHHNETFSPGHAKRSLLRNLHNVMLSGAFDADQYDSETLIDWLLGKNVTSAPRSVYWGLR